MTALVIDASAAAAWIMPSQATGPATKLASRLAEFDLIAPYVFCWEMGNLLLRQSRRGLDLLAGRELLAGLAVVYRDPPAPEAVLGRDMEAAHAIRLSLFDAAYLALALDLDAPLATRDAALISAAERTGAPVLDLR